MVILSNIFDQHININNTSINEFNGLNDMIMFLRPYSNVFEDVLIPITIKDLYLIDEHHDPY